MIHNLPLDYYTHTAHRVYTPSTPIRQGFCGHSAIFFGGEISTKHRKFCVLLFLTAACYCSIPLEASSTYHGRASKRSHRLRFRCWLFITYLHLTIEPSPALIILFLSSSSSWPDVGLDKEFFILFSYKNSCPGIFKAKKKQNDALLCSKFSHFELIGFLRASIYIYISVSSFVVVVVCSVVTVLLFFLLSSCYAGVNLIYVPHARRCCYTTGVFFFFFFFFAFKFFFFVCWARDGYRSSGGCIFPLLDSARHRI